MKNFNTLPIDCSAIIAEAQAYLVAHPDLLDTSTNTTAWIVNSELLQTSETFASLGLTVSNTGFMAIDEIEFAHIDTSNRVAIPINNCQTATLAAYTVNSGAVKISTQVPPPSWLPDTYYNVSDCTFVAASSLSVPMINLATTATVWTSTVRSVILILNFDEDTDFLLAD
jgi:hypothetical protein